MAHVKLSNMSIDIPIYDMSTQRLFKKSSFTTSSQQVGSSAITTHSRFAHICALQHITMDLVDGDCVGLIGHNGAGKSTLLRVLAGIYPHSSGQADIHGSRYLIGGADTIGRDATGYENIELAMQLANIDPARKPDIIADIEEFTGLGEYLHMPTRVYSQGMQARLSFAWANIYNPDILLIDEVIGVGDAAFAEKIEQRIKQYTNHSKILVVASHEDSLLSRLCNKGAVFNAGKLAYFGPVNEALAHYHDTLSKKAL